MYLINRIWLKIMKTWWQITVPFRLRSVGVKLGKNIRFYGMPIASMVRGSCIQIGDRVVLCSDSRFTDLGINHPVVLRTLNESAEIMIGADCGISGGSICAAKHVKLGNECLLGADVTISDTDFHPVKWENRRFSKNDNDIQSAPIHINDNVFIGKGAVILKGVTIGRNSVIGAGSIVIKDVPPNSISVGNPARLIKIL
ncbi:MAG: acyltransferase [Glaciimonas sp.]|nr:acyltransferase [Glaciimonas sp.]